MKRMKFQWIRKGQQTLEGTILIALLAIASLSSASAESMSHPADGDFFDRDRALEISQNAIGTKLQDFQFQNVRGETVSISDFAGRPVVINLIYTSCNHTCPLILESLERSVDVAREALGEESFTVLTIGFDTRVDTYTQMKAYAHSHGMSGKQGWEFLSASPLTIDHLSKQLGFQFVTAPHGFDHLAQNSVVDEAGVLYRQIYGVDIPSPMVVEPLKQLVFGRKSGFSSFSGLLNQVKLYCTIYNPASQRYQFDYSLIVGGVIGFVALFGMAIFLIRNFARLKNAKP
jgi:protein SCO1/2